MVCVGKLVEIHLGDEDKVEAPRLPLVARPEGIERVERELGDVGRERGPVGIPREDDTLLVRVGERKWSVADELGFGVPFRAEFLQLVPRPREERKLREEVGNVCHRLRQAELQRHLVHGSRVDVVQEVSGGNVLLAHRRER